MSFPHRGLVLMVMIVAGCEQKAEETKTSKSGQTDSVPSAVVQNASSSAKAPANPSTVPVEQPATSKPVIFSAGDLAKVMNAGELPQIKGTEVWKKSAAMLTAIAPEKVGDTAEFYRKELVARGWESVPQPSAKVTDEYGSYQFQKEGHILDMSVGKCSDKDKKPQTMVEIVFHGNFDTRTLPVPDGKEDLYTSQALSSYVTNGSVAEAVQWVKKTLQAEGWQEYNTHEASESPKTENRSLKFRKQGYSIAVFIGINPLKKKTHFQYSVAALAHELPTPAEATKVQFDDEGWKLKCEVPGDMKAAAAFYQKAMPAAGYKPLPSEDPRADYWNLRFGTEQGDIIMVQVVSKKGEPTKVFMDGVPAAVLAKMKEGVKTPAGSKQKL